MSITPDPTHGAATGEVTGETVSRPKFSRRPASFSRSAQANGPVAVSEMTALEPLALAPARTAAKPIPGIAWQEDARFGVAMLLLVLLVNLALIYGLPLLPKESASSGPTQVTAKAPSMPGAVGRTANGVTLYSQPETERRTIYLLDLRNTASEQSALSVSPYDTPAPTARALDAETPDQ